MSQFTEEQMQAEWDPVFVLLCEGNCAGALEAARRFARKFGACLRSSMLMAECLIALGRNDEAAVFTSQAQEMVPGEDHPRLWMVWGTLYKKKGNLNLAEKWYRRAADAADQRGLPQGLLAVVFAKQGKLQEANAAHRRATRPGWDFLEGTCTTMGLVLRAEGRYREAIEWLQRALVRDPECAVARAELAITIRALEIKEGGV